MPVLHVVAGPNGAGKTTFCSRILIPATHLPLVNADEIARQRAAESFIAQTVFSHPSKLELIREARTRQYLVSLHVILVPEELSVRRVGLRVEQGGHSVPEASIRARYRRLWALLKQAVTLADEATVYDNARAATPFRIVARYRDGVAQGPAQWPAWSPVRW